MPGGRATPYPAAHKTARRNGRLREVVFPVRVPSAFASALLTPARPPAANRLVRGVNLAGAEFGADNLPGVENRDFVFNSDATFQYFSQQGLNVFRIPFRWERLQPLLGGPLDAAYLAGLRRNAGAARRHGGAVIIEPHNFGRYRINENGALREYVIDNRYNGEVKVSRGHFADFWRRVSAEFKDCEDIWAYNLMNEPHDMGDGDWRLISQTAVDAIRANEDGRRILAPGLAWSNSHVWPQVHGAESWIEDPYNNTEYEAHIYFDRDFSGTYAMPYDGELSLNPDLANIGPARLQPFVAWCRANNVRGMLGEYGIPSTDARWLAVLDTFLSALDEAGASGAYWAGGEWWGDSALSVQPGGNFTTGRPQMEILSRRLPWETFWTSPAAGNAGPALAPGSLASGCGPVLAEKTVQADSLPWPAELAGIKVTLTGQDGVPAPAPLLAVSPAQIHYLVPESLARGWARVSVAREGVDVAAGRVWIEPVAPALFSADGSGCGPAAANVLRVLAGGRSTLEPADQPIDFGAAGDRLLLILWGSGFRGVNSSTRVSLRIGPAEAPVLYAGWGYEIPGVDQLVAELPRSLANRGRQSVVFRADGKASNLVSVTFR